MQIAQTADLLEDPFIQDMIRAVAADDDADLEETVATYVGLVAIDNMLCKQSKHYPQT